ncbi:MAG: hypothetical protein LCH46_07695 [Proteobacteria bacterium]|nr:hypothetical protein [Pseudomonadota bacterium]
MIDGRLLPDSRKRAVLIIYLTVIFQLSIVFIVYYLSESIIERLDEVFHFGAWAWPSVARLSEEYGDANRNRAQLIILASLITPVLMSTALIVVFRKRVLENRTFLSWPLLKTASLALAMVIILFFVFPGAYTGVGIRTKISLTNSFLMLPVTALGGYFAGMALFPFIASALARILRPISRISDRHGR